MNWGPINPPSSSGAPDAAVTSFVLTPTHSEPDWDVDNLYSATVGDLLLGDAVTLDGMSDTYVSPGGLHILYVSAGTMYRDVDPAVVTVTAAGTTVLAQLQLGTDPVGVYAAFTVILPAGSTTIACLIGGVGSTADVFIQDTTGNGGAFRVVLTPVTT